MKQVLYTERRRHTSSAGMHYYVYVLKSSKDNKLYIGKTTNLKRRLQEHARGAVDSTKNRRYLKLIHYEYFVNKFDVSSREVFLKSGAGHEQLSKMLKNTYNEELL